MVYVNDSSKPAPVRAEISQKNRRFHPHVLILPAGSSVDFPNQDNTQHHVYSLSPAKVFNLELYADRPEAPAYLLTGNGCWAPSTDKSRIT
jgi:plastocyanin